MFKCMVWDQEQQHGAVKGQFMLIEAPLQFSFDVSDHLDEAGNNELLLGVYDPTNNADGVPLGKQRSHSGHRQQVGNTNIVYTSSSGIWQTVSSPQPCPWLASLAALQELHLCTGRCLVCFAVQFTGTAPQASNLDAS